MKRLIGYGFIAIILLVSACGGEPAEVEESATSPDTLKTEGEGATLETPVEVSAGSPFQVAWTGPSGQNDYLTIVEEGAPKGSYLSYTYTRDGSPLQLTAADTPGKHEVRYVSGEGKEILASAPITVLEVEASLQAPAEIGAGSRFDVSWTGPDNDNDYVTIVEKGAPKGSYQSYTYTREGTPVKLTAPEKPGEYEVRYVMGQSKRVLTSAPIAVQAVEASLSAPEEVMIETPIEVTWTGPGNEQDYITIAEKGAPEQSYLSYTYTREGSPLNVRAPKSPGVYELRYVTGQSKNVLTQRTITVKPLSATLEAESQLTAGASLTVNWTGPNNPEDFISVAKKGDPAKSYESRAYSRAGNPAQLFAPSSPGEYEVRYVLGKTSQILASSPLEVTSQ